MELSRIKLPWSSHKPPPTIEAPKSAWAREKFLDSLLLDWWYFSEGTDDKILILLRKKHKPELKKVKNFSEKIWKE